MTHLAKSRNNSALMRRIEVVILYLCYFCALQIVYQNWITSQFGYEGYLDKFSLNGFLISLAVLIISTSALRVGGRPSDLFLHLAAALILVPSLVFYSGADLPLLYLGVTAGAFLALVSSTRLLPCKRLKFIEATRNQLLFVCVASALITLGGILAFGGARFINFDLSAVYDIRREASEAIPGVFGYLNSVVTKVIIPFAMVLALVTRRWFLMLFLFGLSIMFFALTAHKSPLFYPVVVLFIYGVSGSKRLVRYLVMALLAVVVLSGIDLWYAEAGHGGIYGWFGTLFARRTLLTPALLNWDYIEYFSKAEKYYWAFSKFSLGLVGSDYAVNSANLIGWEYFGRDEMSANTGWIGSGYANAGFMGILGYSIIMGLIFSLVDLYAEKVGARLAVAMFVLPVMTMLADSDLTNMFLNHGLLVAILLLMMLPQGKSEMQARGGRRLRPVTQ